MARIALATLMLIIVASPLDAWSADRVILGKQLKVDDPSTPARRRIRGVGRELATDVPSLSDPRIAGATLTVMANGATDSIESFVLDGAGWATVANGYRYTGPTAADGDPVRRVLLTRTPTGRTAITILVIGSLGTQPLVVVPPNPGSSGGFVLDVAGGDRYCVQLGALAGGTTRKDDARRWNIRNAATEAGCPTPDTTTTTTTTTSTTTTTTVAAVCGNGVLEVGEACDGTDVSGFCVMWGATGCFPDGPDECDCCIPPAGVSTFLFTKCCNGGVCTFLGPHYCECPGTCESGSYPTCGGSCTQGNVCVPGTDGGSFQGCVCAPAGDCNTCGGGNCPAGLVCNINTCGCVAP
jgi:hypothetical protein